MLILQPQRPKISSHKGAFYKQDLGNEISGKIEELCKKHNTTHFVFYLTAFSLLLQRYCRQDDFLLGTPISNRSKASLERMIGFFNETIILRFNIEQDISFLEHLQNVRKTVMDAFSNKDIPLETLIKKLGVNREISTNPLFQAMFLYHQVPESPVWKGFEIEYETFDAGTSKFDLTLYVAEDEGNYSSTFEFDSEIFDQSTIERMLDHYHFLLKQIADNPNISISELSLTSPAEKEAIYELLKNDKAYESNIGIHTLIEHQLERRAEEKAVTAGNRSWNYVQLINSAYKIAHHLLDLGLKKGDVVGVCTSRNIEMVGGILGGLMAGGVYMPLDPEYPQERISYMLNEAEVSYVLCEEGQESLFSSAESHLIRYLDIVNSVDPPRSSVNVPIEGKDNAYLIFTSGSSGKPKGVLVSHANIIHSTVARDYFYPSLPESFLLLSSFAFDSSMVGLFWTLCRGGNLVLTPEKIEQDMDLLSRMIKQNEVSHTLMLPSLYQILLDQADQENLTTLKCVIVAGEACLSKMCSDHFEKVPQARLYNEYGPTEASVWCTGYEITKADIGNSIPIGPAITSTDIFVLDKFGKMVPRGIPGEIYIGGRGITKGYINRKDLTNEKFINHDFEQQFPSLLYRSGDLGKMRMDGVLEFLGRADHQIKIRGFRVELTEIQNVLQSISDFEEIVVVALKHEGQSESNRVKSIVAFYISNEELDIPQIKSEIGEKLPDYMVPSLFIRLETMPKLPNGKYDYNYLENKDISDQVTESSSYEGPRNDIERTLISIWEEVLDVKPIGIYDNFFSLGGDSILSIQINGKAHNLGLKLPANEIFKSQTVAKLSQHVETKVEIKSEEIFHGVLSLTPIQRWYLENFKNDPGHWHLGVRFDFSEDLNVEYLKKAVELIVNRHESLRIRLRAGDAINAEVDEFDEKCVLIQKMEINNDAEREEFIQSGIRRVTSSTQLEKGGLFKCLYFYGQGFGDNCLIFLAHHFVIDNVSWNILIEEFGKALGQIENGLEVNLGEKSLSYHKWTPMLKIYARGGTFRKDQSIWSDLFSALDSLKVDDSIIFQEKDVERVRYTIDAKLTQLLTLESTQTYDAKVNEIVISAFILAMKKWKSKSTLVVETEGHGRESSNQESTFHNSVGWYTSLYPIFFKMDEDRDSLSNLKYVKNTVRSIPSKGLTFGICKYLQSDIETKKYAYKADVLINYLGKLNYMFHDRFGKASMLTSDMRSERSERLHPLELNIYIQDKELVFEGSFVKNYCNGEEFDELISLLKEELINISEQKEVNTAHNYVPADFQDVDLDEEDLDNLFDQL